MRRISASLLFIAVGVWTAAAESAEPGAYMTPQPLMAEVQLVGENLVISRGIPKPIHETQTATRKVGGVDQTYVYTVTRFVTVPHEGAVTPNDYRCFDMQGKQLDFETLAARLSKPTPVLVYDHAGKVDPQYLALYKADTLIVYLRPQAMPGPHLPGPRAPSVPGAPEA